MFSTANFFSSLPSYIIGLLARQRKEELKRLNNQLRQINTALRRQAHIESFAPGLTYAPVGRATETEVIVGKFEKREELHEKSGP